MTPAVLEIESNPDTTTVPLLAAGAVAETQQAAWEKFQSLPPPSRSDEAWRFSTIKALDLASFTAAQSVDDTTREELLDLSTGLDVCAGRMVFANDAMLSREAFEIGRAHV